MSRKANRLRNRLRIQGEQHAAREAALEARAAELRKWDAQNLDRAKFLAAEEAKLSRRAALSIVIEESFAQAGRLFQVVVPFYPDALFYRGVRAQSGPIDVNRMASDVAMDVARMVHKGILQVAKERMGR